MKRQNQIEKLFVLRDINTEQQHVPDSDQFVVFMLKKGKKLKLQRLYQCRCQAIDNINHDVPLTD